MNKYNLIELAEVCGGTNYGQSTEAEITELLFDSRRVYRAEQSLFIALRTDRSDGHRFIPDLIRQGVRSFLVTQLPHDELLSEANFILVNDSLLALQKIAAWHRRKFSFPVVAITGSNGKTIVKEWIFELMRSEKHIVRSPKSYNSQIGVPLSVWLLSSEHEMALIEAGISRPREMDALREIIQPDYGIITNIGSAHLENFGTKKAILSEKLKLFRGARKVYYCSDQELVSRMLSLENSETVSWGKNEDTDYRIVTLNQDGQRTKISLIHRGTEHTLVLPFSDEASVENAIHAAVFAIDQGANSELLKTNLLKLRQVEMRLELSKGKQQSTLINDSYSADQESLKIALDYMLQQVQHQNRTVILSDLLETGKPSEILYRELSELLYQKGISRLIGIGNNIQLCEHSFDGESVFFKTTEELLQHLPSISFYQQCVLIKGARLFGFERIFSALQEKFHETVLEVNLSAMIENLKYYKSLLPASVKTMAMVKAFSYGSGSAEVASVLQAHNIDYLAVAYADEGIELRKAGITVPIMVMNPELSTLSELVSYGLEPEIYSFRLLHQLGKIVRESSGYAGYPVNIHIKLDTGMHRLGFGEQDISELCNILRQQEWISVASVFSHLVSSEDAEQDEFTRLQIERFRRWSDLIQVNTGQKFLKHILNSSGVVRHPSGYFDMVRLGIGLYGIGSLAEQKNLRPVSRLKTTVSQIHHLDKGETVGYGRKGLVDTPKRIATIAIGYADGFSRVLGNGKGYVYVRGHKAYTIGNICMDMCMLDVTHIAGVQEGDEVIVFEDAAQLKAIAGILGTIPYEILTGISSRVKRVYFQE